MKVLCELRSTFQMYGFIISVNNDNHQTDSVKENTAMPQRGFKAMAVVTSPGN